MQFVCQFTYMLSCLNVSHVVCQLSAYVFPCLKSHPQPICKLISLSLWETICHHVSLSIVSLFVIVSQCVCLSPSMPACPFDSLRVFLSICLFLCKPIYPLVYLSLSEPIIQGVCLPLCKLYAMSVCLCFSACLSVCMSLYLFSFLCAYLSACLFVSLEDHLSACLCLSVSQSVSVFFLSLSELICQRVYVSLWAYLSVCFLVSVWALSVQAAFSLQEYSNISVC